MGAPQTPNRILGVSCHSWGRAAALVAPRWLIDGLYMPTGGASETGPARQNGFALPSAAPPIWRPPSYRWAPGSVTEVAPGSDRVWVRRWYTTRDADITAQKRVPKIGYLSSWGTKVVLRLAFGGPGAGQSPAPGPPEGHFSTTLVLRKLRYPILGILFCVMLP